MAERKRMMCGVQAACTAHSGGSFVRGRRWAWQGSRPSYRGPSFLWERRSGADRRKPGGRPTGWWGVLEGSDTEDEDGEVEGMVPPASADGQGGVAESRLSKQTRERTRGNKYTGNGCDYGAVIERGRVLSYGVCGQLHRRSTLGGLVLLHGGGR